MAARNSQGINHNEVMVNGRLVKRKERAKTEEAKKADGDLHTNSIDSAIAGRGLSLESNLSCQVPTLIQQNLRIRSSNAQLQKCAFPWYASYSHRLECLRMEIFLEHPSLCFLKISSCLLKLLVRTSKKLLSGLISKLRCILSSGSCRTLQFRLLPSLPQPTGRLTINSTNRPAEH